MNEWLNGWMDVLARASWFCTHFIVRQINIDMNSIKLESLQVIIVGMVCDLVLCSAFKFSGEQFSSIENMTI